MAHPRVIPGEGKKGAREGKKDAREGKKGAREGKKGAAPFYFGLAGTLVKVCTHIIGCCIFGPCLCCDFVLLVRQFLGFAPYPLSITLILYYYVL